MRKQTILIQILPKPKKLNKNIQFDEFVTKSNKNHPKAKKKK